MHFSWQTVHLHTVHFVSVDFFFPFCIFSVYNCSFFFFYFQYIFSVAFLVPNIFHVQYASFADTRKADLLQKVYSLLK